MFHRRLLPLLALGSAAFLTGCGDDSSSPQQPEDDGIVDFPADAATLQEAIDLVEPGGTIVVADGTYTVDEELVFVSGLDDVTLKGADGSRPRLVFTVAAGSDDAITISARGVSVENLEIDGTFRVGVLIFSSGCAVRNCVIRNAAWYSVSCSVATADAAVVGNVMVDSGIFGVHCTGGADPLVERNTIVGAGDCGIYSFNSMPDCHNNIVVGADNYGIACFGPQLALLDCNVLFDNFTSDYSIDCVPGASDQHADPLFCETTDYTLMAGSPCAEANAGACGGIGAVQEICPVETSPVRPARPRDR
jgi:hypothetical protein